MAIEISTPYGSADASWTKWSADASDEKWGADAKADEYRAFVTTGVMVGGVPYSGTYSITPSEEAQTLQTSMRTLSGDVTIQPIPSNYGRIAWDGSKITVY